MADLFSREQQILDNAAAHLEEIRQGAPVSGDQYARLVKEYGRLLRQMQRLTRISDQTACNLNASRLDLMDQMHYDCLTGIHNRRYLEERLRSVVERLHLVDDSLLSVLMVDVDYFKRYNDTYGHSMGDDCLRAIAQVLAESVKRSDDFVARYGGEEFVAVLPNTDRAGACSVAEKILSNVMACGIPHEKSEVAPCITVSVGVTTGRVAGVDGKEFIGRADQALYQSKEGGRNRYTYIPLEEGAE